MISNAASIPPLLLQLDLKVDKLSHKSIHAAATTTTAAHLESQQVEPSIRKDAPVGIDSCDSTPCCTQLVQGAAPALAVAPIWKRK